MSSIDRRTLRGRHGHFGAFSDRGHTKVRMVEKASYEPEVGEHPTLDWWVTKCGHTDSDEDGLPGQLPGRPSGFGLLGYRWHSIDEKDPRWQPNSN